MISYSTLLITHRIVVTLFLLHYIIKLLLLLVNNGKQLEPYTKVTRIPEMIVSVLFLITGVWLMIQIATTDIFLIIKLVCIFAAIPLAVIGFKRRNKMLAILSVILILAAYGLAEVHKKHKGDIKTDASANTTLSANDPISIGQKLYTGSCITCHGADGKLGNSGAKDLTATQLTADQQKELIRHGKGAMPEYPAEALSDEQLNDVVLYIGTFKK